MPATGVTTIDIALTAAGESLRRFRAAAGRTRFVRWRNRVLVTDRLVAVPQNMRPANAELAADYYAGHYVFGGRTMECGTLSPFAVDDAIPEWMVEAHSFRWLRHLRAADRDLARVHMQGLVLDWIDLRARRMTSPVWDGDTTAKRLIAWLVHSEWIAKGLSETDQRKLLRVMGRHARFLTTNFSTIRDGVPRLRAAIAILVAAFCLGGREKTVKQAARRLERELTRQILPDGGHLSRRGDVLADLLADLMLVRKLFDNQTTVRSGSLDETIERMGNALRFLRHRDGALAQFNGTGATDQALIDHLLLQLKKGGELPQSAPSSGYERLEAGKTVVIADAGTPPPLALAKDAMAGTLAFELSHGAQRFIANCGIGDYDRGTIMPFARATAAHNTAVVGEASSSRFATGAGFARLLPSALLRGPRKVESRRAETDETLDWTGSHDGYSDGFGLIHRRALHLARDGKSLTGADCFERVEKSKHAGAKPFAIRFHLAPGLSASQLASGHSILIAAADGTAFTFTCIDAEMTLSESVSFSHASGARKCEQIVLSGMTDASPEVRWAIVLREKARTGRGRKAKDAMRDAPDLLDIVSREGA